jgi:pimeloyl-ACP methyl ester carboxylesterase
LRRILTALLVLAATLAAPAIPVVAAPPLDPGVPAGLQRCSADSEAYCGSVDVPLDRTGRTPGSLSIAFRYYPRSDTGRPSLPTIVAHEGGPGYSTTGSKSYYLDLYRPLMDRRALLLVDERGTGRSGALYCPEAESYDGHWVANAEACAERLGRAADLYTTAAAVEDMADVLAELKIDAIDLYGDSYGSFFAQAFAVRHPELVRSIVLDGTYPIEGLDPWYRTTGARLLENISLACARSRPTCPTTPRAACSMCSPTWWRASGRTPSLPRRPTPGGGRSR